MISTMGSTTLYSSPLALLEVEPVCHSPQIISASLPSILTAFGSVPHFTVSALQLSWPFFLVTQQQEGNITPLLSLSLHIKVQCADPTMTVGFGGTARRLTAQRCSELTPLVRREQIQG